MTAEDTLRNTADSILKQQFGPGNPPEATHIRNAVEAASGALGPVIPGCKDPATIEAVIRTLQTNWNVYVEDSRVIELRTNDHKEWLTQSMGLIDPSRPAINWRFWNRYRNYLETEKGRPEAVIRSLDKATTEVLRRLEDPLRQGEWDRRGMVVGSVQSGKTGNYTGLICKAADAGYRIIIILSGMYENLRRQTQVRLDEEFRGRQTRDALESEQWIGVGRLDSSFLARSATTSAIDSRFGDFNKDVAQRRGLLEPGVDVLYMVVKKNGSILKNINKWLQTLPQFQGRKIRGVPLLIIDDECDQATVNTREVDPDEEEQDMTPINREVRRLLSLFEQSAYVGYTATPFANIFINPESRDINVEEDLFPRDFILSLEPPTNYLGPAELFGLAGGPGSDLEAREGLPLVREVDDHHEAFPAGHRKEYEPPGLPPTLREAIRCFILACAVRWQRGQTRKHNSMLIHASRYNQVQGRITDLVLQEYESLKTRIEMNDGQPGNDEAPIFEEFRVLWERDFVSTSAQIEGYSQSKWNELLPHLRDVGTRIQVMTVNGLAGQALNYDTEAQPLNVIAIGGDKFSRGFTLEGLTVSYYLRATNMYDTLMQMGRWFGYRDGYLDVCRIYTTPALRDAYSFIAGAIEELRRDFRRMARENARPVDFGHKVRLHPGSALLVTSRDKSRGAIRMRSSLDGRLAQTLVLSLDPERHSKNLANTSKFLDELRNEAGDPVRERGMRKWEGIPGERVLRFIQEFDVHGRNSFEVAQLLPRFIERRLSRGELVDWTVAFDTFENSKGMPHQIAGQSARAAVREHGSKVELEAKAVRLKVLTTPQHEMVDLTPDQRNQAAKESEEEFKADLKRGEGRRRKGTKAPENPYPDIIRQQRDAKRGLLLIYFVDPQRSWKTALEGPAVGFGISFPRSREDDPGVEYLANLVWQWEAGLD